MYQRQPARTQPVRANSSTSTVRSDDATAYYTLFTLSRS
jgi:hypothetical protein